MGPTGVRSLPIGVTMEIVRIFVNLNENTSLVPEPHPSRPGQPFGHGGRRYQENAPHTVGALYSPPRPQTAADPLPYEMGIILVHDWAENFHSEMMCSLGEGLASGGYFTLALNLSRHDDQYRGARLEWSGQQIQTAADYLLAMGLTGVFVVGHGFGTVDAAEFRDMLPGSIPYGLQGLVHVGPRITARSLGVLEPLSSTAERAVLGGQARASVLGLSGGAPVGVRPREYVLASRGWAMEAESFDDFFGTALVGRIGSINVQLLRGDRARFDPLAVPAGIVDPSAAVDDVIQGFLPGHLTLYPARLAPASTPSGGAEVTNQFVEDNSGSVLGAFYYRPSGEPSKDAVITLFHGGWGSTFYDPLLFSLGRCLAARGFTVLSCNRRDFGVKFGQALSNDALADASDQITFAGTETGFEVYALGASVGSIYATAATKARNAAAANTVQGLILLAPLSSYRRYLQGNLVPASFAALAIAPAAGDQKWLIWEGGNPPEDGLSWITSHDDAALRTLIDPVAAPPGPEIDVATAGAPVLIMWSLADTLAPKVDHAEPVYDAVPVTAGSLPASAVLLELTDQGGAGYGPLHAREGHWFFRMDQTNAEAITTWIGGAVPAVGGNIVVVTSK